MPYSFLATAAFGLEGIVSNELKRLGYSAKAEQGCARFTGELADGFRANLCLRTADRVLLLLDEKPVLSFEELFQGVKALPWERWIGKKDRFPVKGWSLDSQLHSVPDCQSIVKKAVVERLRSVYHLSWFEETGALFQIQFTILKDEVTVMLDTSGAGLHKRGYRARAGGAPIKETLAAAIVDPGAAGAVGVRPLLRIGDIAH